SVGHQALQKYLASRRTIGPNSLSTRTAATRVTDPTRVFLFFKVAVLRNEWRLSGAVSVVDLPVRCFSVLGVWGRFDLIKQGVTREILGSQGSFCSSALDSRGTQGARSTKKGVLG